jgi:hypothetical protein
LKARESDLEGWASGKKIVFKEPRWVWIFASDLEEAMGGLQKVQGVQQGSIN